MTFLDMWEGWIWVAGGAFGLTTILISLVYMVSELLQNDKMKTWAKMELVEIFYSALIIAMAISALPLIDAVVQGSLGVSNTGSGGSGVPGPLGTPTSAWIKTHDAGMFLSGQPYQALDICGSQIAQSNQSVYHGVESCHIRLGIYFMQEIFNEAETFAFDIYQSYINTSMLSAFTINIEFVFEKAGFFTFTPWAGFYTMGNKVKELVFDWAIKLMMLVKFQEVLLNFIATALFPALFVIGAILRTFAPTRKIGGLLLAIALSMYFIFPSFYALGALVMLSLKNDPTISSTWIHDSIANPQGLANPDPPIAYTMYYRENVTTLGGSYTSADMQTNLQTYEGLSPQDYMSAMEQNSLNGQHLLPQFDMTSTQYQNATEAQQNASFANAWNAASNWYNNVSLQNKLDQFVGSAWSQNGPLDSLARLTFWATFFSLLSIIATIAGIRSLSITFGGDVEIAGLTRLI